MDGGVKEMNIRVIGRGTALGIRGVECPWETNMFLFVDNSALADYSEEKLIWLVGMFGEVC